MLYPVHLFADQVQIRPTKEIVRFSDRAGERILNGKERNLRFTTGHRIKGRRKRGITVILNV